MKIAKLSVLASAVLFFVALGAFAQQKPVSTLRQPNPSAVNDTVLEGTVVSYTEDSATAPIGAHVVVQTSSGNIDVHLGKAALVKQSGISLREGDSVRIVGSSVPFAGGTIFAARILQKGAQSVTLRNSRGIPLSNARRTGTPNPQTQGGAR
jgi:hypothetical protein